MPMNSRASRLFRLKASWRVSIQNHKNPVAPRALNATVSAPAAVVASVRGAAAGLSISDLQLQLSYDVNRVPAPYDLGRNMKRVEVQT